MTLDVSKIKNPELRKIFEQADYTGNKDGKVGNHGFEAINFKNLALNVLNEKKCTKQEFEEVMGLFKKEYKDIDKSYDPTNGDTQNIYEYDENHNVKKTPIKIWLMVYNFITNFNKNSNSNNSTKWGGPHIPSEKDKPQIGIHIPKDGPFGTNPDIKLF